MKTNVLVGCDAVDAGPEWVRLREAGGSLRTIAWNSIRMAATPTNDDHMTFEGDGIEKITALRATHDPLWIECDDRVDIALLEKDNPQRDAIVATFTEHLGARWSGDRLTMQDAAMRLFKVEAVGRGFNLLKLMIIAMAVMLLVVMVLVLVSKAGH